MVTVSAPGKVILLGEHAVLYGEPCLSTAIDLRTEVQAVVRGKTYRVNSSRMDSWHHTYIKAAVDYLWKGDPIHFRTRSNILSAGGIGSSAALTVATVGCLSQLGDEWDKDQIAQKSYEVEYSVQDGGSPNDTSASTFGSGILLSDKQGDNLLWGINKGERQWFIHHVDIPPFTLVIGNTGIKSKTPIQIKKVRRFVQHSGFSRDLITQIGGLVHEGVKALKDEDYTTFGKLMNMNQNILHTMGASTKELQRLINISLKAGAYGAKLTGAGGGGSIIVLTDNPHDVSQAIRDVGGISLIVKPSREGATIVG
jgi:mevalonate kinase